MPQRQLRINSSIQIQTRIAEFLGKKINIVLADKGVLFGELIQVQSTNIVLMNMRQKKVVIPLLEINELYLDFTT